MLIRDLGDFVDRQEQEIHRRKRVREAPIRSPAWLFRSKENDSVRNGLNTLTWPVSLPFFRMESHAGCVATEELDAAVR
jgi:hypothetical protein